MEPRRNLAMEHLGMRVILRTEIKMLYVRREGVIAQLELFEREAGCGVQRSRAYLLPRLTARICISVCENLVRKFASSVRRERERKRDDMTVSCALDAGRCVIMVNLFFQNYNIK